MNPLTKRTLTALILVPAALCLQAETTGRISGKITNKKGEPLPNAVVTLKRIDINWNKVLVLGPKGTFLQVGLEPKDFDLVVTCPGYADYSRRVKIPLGEATIENVTMLTAQESLVEAKATGKVPVDDAGAAAEGEATEAANQAFTLYKEKKFADARPLLEKAQLKFKESLDKTKDEKLRTGLEEGLATSERVLGIVLAHSFAADPANPELATRALPLLEKALARKAEDPFVLQAIVDLARARKDADLEKKYKPALDKLVGPKPEAAYNDAVTAFNAGKAAEAKALLQKALQIDPKFSESYYLLGMIEYGNNNLKACKDALMKYLELDPNGKKAGDVKEMLNDPSLKKIK